MKILVIGKNGYVSTCFQNYMKKYDGIQVDAISARKDAWKQVDFRGYDAVFNTTGLAHNDARKGTEEEFIELNAKLPKLLATKAKKEGVPEFVHMSSMIVYGNMSPIGTIELIKEDTVPVPTNIYGKSKLMGEKAILELNDDVFHVAVIRSPLIYGETAVDNFLALTNYAVTLPVFPYIKNIRSMIYSDNLCEIVWLIIQNKSSGLFFPQQEEYICTSKIIKEIASLAGHKVIMVKCFENVLKPFSKWVMLIRRVFGSLAYDMNMSNHFDGMYRVVSYNESIRRIAMTKTNR